MAARNGKESLDRLRASRPAVYVEGEELSGGIADHPAFRNVVRSYAEHVQEDIAEIISTLETLRAFLRASEADAAINEYGVLTPAWAPLNTRATCTPSSTSASRRSCASSAPPA